VTAVCRSGWSKEPQWDNASSSFLPCFLLVSASVPKPPPPKTSSWQPKRFIHHVVSRHESQWPSQVKSCHNGGWWFVMDKFSSNLSALLGLSLNSSWFLVGSWLFCLQNLPCLVRFWCMRGGSVEVWTKNILYRFMEGQTHFGMPKRGVKTSLTLHEPI
jgi:hypothetical protein